MAIPFINRRNIDFLLFELLDAEQLNKFPHYKDHDKDSFKAILDVALQIATEKFHPHNTDGDRNEPVVVDGRVKLIPEGWMLSRRRAYSALPTFTSWGGYSFPK